MGNVAMFVKIEVGQSQQAPLESCLEIWMRWQERNDVGIGWHRRSAMLSSDASADSEQLYASMDNTVAEAVEAMISSLPRHLDWAIRTRCGIATVWRFPNLDYHAALVDAETQLTSKLQKNIATRALFV